MGFTTQTFYRWKMQCARDWLRLARRCVAMKMSGSVTTRAQRDEILLGVIPQPAARADVVRLEIVRRAAILGQRHPSRASRR